MINETNKEVKALNIPKINIKLYNKRYSIQFSSLNFDVTFFKQNTQDSYESIISNNIHSKIDDKSSSVCSSYRITEPSKGLYTSMVEPKRHYSVFQSDHIITFDEQGKEVLISNYQYIIYNSLKSFLIH